MLLGILFSKKEKMLSLFWISKQYMNVLELPCWKAGDKKECYSRNNLIPLCILMPECSIFINWCRRLELTASEELILPDQWSDLSNATLCLISHNAMGWNPFWSTLDLFHANPFKLTSDAGYFVVNTVVTQYCVYYEIACIKR